MANRSSSKGKRGGRSKRSKAEASTGAKENGVDVRKVSIGDNSLALPDPKDFDHHYKSMRGARDKVQTAQALSSQASESANKCSPGLAKIIKETLKIENENDPVKLQRHLNMLGMGLKHINSTVQISIFDTLAGDVAEQAYKRGVDDGENARGSNQQYPEGSDLAGHYTRGWQHGTAKNMGLSPEQSDSALSEVDPERQAAE